METSPIVECLIFKPCLKRGPKFGLFNAGLNVRRNFFHLKIANYLILFDFLIKDWRHISFDLVVKSDCSRK